MKNKFSTSVLKISSVNTYPFFQTQFYCNWKFFLQLAFIFFVAAFITACGLQWTKPDPDNIVMNKRFLTPPYYNNNQNLSGLAFAYKIHLDPLLEVESLKQFELNQYMLTALPVMNDYFANRVQDKILERYQHKWPDFPQLGLLPPNQADRQDNTLRLFDLPKIHYGTPEQVLGPFWPRSEPDPDYRQSMLTLVDGSTKWQAVFQANSINLMADYVLDISIGVIDVSPVTPEVLSSTKFSDLNPPCFWEAS